MTAIACIAMIMVPTKFIALTFFSAKEIFAPSTTKSHFGRTVMKKSSMCTPPKRLKVYMFYTLNPLFFFLLTPNSMPAASNP
jgi:hypothetical protein